MAFPGGHFHKTVRSVLIIQHKSEVHENRSRYDHEPDVNPLVYPYHIHNDEQYEDGKQTASEDEQVLTVKSFELRRFSNPPVN